MHKDYYLRLKKAIIVYRFDMIFLRELYPTENVYWEIEFKITGTRLLLKAMR